MIESAGRAVPRRRRVCGPGRGANKSDWHGVVDVIAIRKDTFTPKRTGLKRGDLFDIVLVQSKGGSAGGPTDADKVRPRKEAKHYRARAVIQFAWRNGRSSDFSVLMPSGKWKPATGAEIFG